MRVLPRLAAFVGFLLASGTSQELINGDEWNGWLAAVGATRSQYENLVLETAHALNMKGEELVESLVSSYSSVEGAPDPVNLLMQLREELQLATDLTAGDGGGDGEAAKKEPEKENVGTDGSTDELEVSDEEDDEPAAAAPSVEEVADKVAAETSEAEAVQPDDDAIKEEEEEEEEANTNGDGGSEETAPLEPREKMNGALDEIKEQVLSDLAQVKRALNLVLPKPVVIAIGQALSTVGVVLNEVRKVAVVSVLPKLKELVLDEGSPGRVAGGRLKTAFVEGFELARAKVIAMINPGEGGGEAETADEEAEEAGLGHEGSGSPQPGVFD